MQNQITANEAWGKTTLEKLLLSTLKEQTTKRRWRIFFLLLSFSYVLFITWYSIYGSNGEISASDALHKTHTAQVDIVGPIMQEQGVAATQVIEGMQAAFKAKNCKGLLLRINSPGGSGVQAHQIYKEIKRLRATRPELPVYAVIEDMGASAAYWVASAADQIYADEVSLVGSIGVLINSFGVVNAMEKLGVERRLYTAGKNKGMLDPFSPKKQADDIFIQQQLDLIHQRFIASVKAGRKDKLAADDDIFSGRFWAGDAAKNLGLIDDFADLNYVAREIIKEPKIVDYTVGASMIDRLAKRVGASIGSSLLVNKTALEF